MVTEAKAGIGRATALRFAEEGAAVACIDADPSQAQETVAQITALGGRGTVHSGDVSAAADCERIAAEIGELLGGVDVLYNNASTLSTGTVADTAEDEWDRLFAVNVKAIYLMSRACLPLMRARGGGCIVNLASSLAFIGYPGLAAYTATKGAVRILSKSMALDHASEGIRVNAICHGGIDDPLLRSLFDATPDPDASLRSFLEGIPLGRLASVRDMANAALFLASDESASTTGSEVLVDGGQTAR